MTCHHVTLPDGGRAIVRPGVYAKPGRKPPRVEQPTAAALPESQPVAAEVQPAAAGLPEDRPELLIGLWSDRSMVLQRGKERMDFGVDEVRKILRFLDAVGVVIAEEA